MVVTVSSISTVFVIVSAYLAKSSFSLPTGAGGCEGSGSVDGGHVTVNNLTTGHLMDYGLQVFIRPQDESLTGEDPEVELVNGYERNILLQRPYQIRLTAASEEKGFRGFLFRITSPFLDTDGYFYLAEDLTDSERSERQLSQVCNDLGIGGVTHTNNTLKAQTDAILRLDEEGRDFFMEVTAVIQNREENGTFRSQYYWDSYTFHVVTNSSELVPSNDPPISDNEDSSRAASPVLEWVTRVYIALLFLWRVVV